MKSQNTDSGFTLIEIIVVLALIGAIFGALAPNFSIIPSTRASITLGRLASDVRNAFDVTVLSGKTHRMVFELKSGKYWLEVAGAENFKIDTEKLRYDPSVEDEEEKQATFDELFKKYEDLAGESIFDPETESQIKPESPVLKAKDKLRPTKWTEVDYQEWGVRDLLPTFIISEILVEHLDEVQRIENVPDNARVMLYFFPQGFVERAQLKIAFLNSDEQIDTTKDPYIITTEPYMGTIDVTGSIEELELEENDS